VKRASKLYMDTFQHIFANQYMSSLKGEADLERALISVAYRDDEYETREEVLKLMSEVLNGFETRLGKQ